MATVFHDQVEAVARRTGVARSELLGRALAHEIGHLLLGVRGHSRTGLMRAVWTDDELTRDRPEDWMFTSDDRERLQQVFIEN
jgi:predicted Zn-dependent protease